MSNWEDIQAHFAGRTPSLNSRGNVRGFRSRPGAPMAQTTSGLSSPTMGMDASSWVNTFRNTSAATQAQALNERAARPDFNKYDPASYRGITHGVVDSVMGNGAWAHAIGQNGVMMTRNENTVPTRVPISTPDTPYQAVQPNAQPDIAPDARPVAKLAGGATPFIDSENARLAARDDKMRAVVANAKLAQQAASPIKQSTTQISPLGVTTKDITWNNGVTGSASWGGTPSISTAPTTTNWNDQFKRYA